MPELLYAAACVAVLLLAAGAIVWYETRRSPWSVVQRKDYTDEGNSLDSDRGPSVR